MVRKQINFKRLVLTDFKIEIPRLAKKKVLSAALEESGAPAHRVPQCAYSVHQCADSVSWCARCARCQVRKCFCASVHGLRCESATCLLECIGLYLQYLPCQQLIMHELAVLFDTAQRFMRATLTWPSTSE